MVPWVGLQYVIVVFPDHLHFRFGPRIQKNDTNFRPVSQNVKSVAEAPMLTMAK